MPRVPKYAIPVVIGLIMASASLAWGTQAGVISGIATILLTAILVSITWYYADETRTLRQEAQTSRLFNLPVLRLTGTLTSEPNVMVRNIGQGFAADVTLIITELDDNKPPVITTLDVPIIGPGEGIEFKPRSYPIRTINGFGLENSSITFHAVGSYVDAAGFMHNVDDEFSLSDYITRCESLGVEFASIRRENDFVKSLEERDFRKSVPASLKVIADRISRLHF